MTHQLAVLGGTPAFDPALPLVRPTLEDIPGMVQQLEQVLSSGMLTNGPRVAELEARLAERLEVPHVVAVSNCTAGLMLALQAVGATGPVVMPSLTFAASAHAVIWAGGTPVFAEVEPESLTLDPDDAASLVEGAAAMTATHVYGNPCQVERLQEVAERAGIPLIYDAAHALGSRRAGRPVGGFGSAEVFSLSPTKVTTAGEGGIVATRDAGIAEAVRVGRGYGNPGDYDCLFAGLNARMSELHAVVALSSLERLDERIAHRNDLVSAFVEALEGVPGLRVPTVAEEDLSTYKDLTLVVEPDVFGLTVPQLTLALRAEGIDSRRYYWPPIHRQKAYAHLPRTRELPVTDDLADRVITPPLWSHMTAEQLQRIAQLLGDLHTRAREVAEAVGA
jgi:dTDP-4-amino-4,6-dideoxygalactose transaminase